MHISVRKLRGCRRKRLKALAMSLAIDDLARSGTPAMPVQTQPTLDNAEMSTQCTIPDSAISTPFDIPNPIDNFPSLLDNSQTEISNIFHADISQTLPVLQFDDFSLEMLRAGERGDGCHSSCQMHELLLWDAERTKVEPAQEHWVGDAFCDSGAELARERQRQGVSSMAACRFSAQPDSCKEYGHGRHSTIDFSMTMGERRPCSCRHLDFIDDYQKVETRQVASDLATEGRKIKLQDASILKILCNRRAPIITSDIVLMSNLLVIVVNKTLNYTLGT